jgi:hypothetical protein
VNHVFKAVRIPGPGEWDVRFEYRPKRWRLALGMAGIGLLILAGFVLTGVGLSFRRRSPYSEKPFAVAPSSGISMVD